MDKTKSMSRNRNQNHDEAASSKKKVKTGDNGGVGPWSDLNHHLLYLVMMQLGLVDYLSFGGVCKSWRSLAKSNRKSFMASKPAMTMRLPSLFSHKKPCYLEDSEGRKFKTTLPCFSGGVCLGLTCGYLIFFRRTTRDFWLVNPITRDELSFTDFPTNDYFCMYNVRAILVFSVSINEWVFLVMCTRTNQIWYSIADTGEWDDVYCKYSFTDLCAFKGTIYSLNNNPDNDSRQCVYELRLNPEPKLTLLEIQNSLNLSYFPQLVSSGENIYVMVHVHPDDGTEQDLYRFQELDFGEMKWVMREKTLGEYASFLCNMKHGVVVKPGWCESGSGLLLGHCDGDVLKRIEVEKASSFSANMWYFPHECVNVDLVD